VVRQSIMASGFVESAVLRRAADALTVEARLNQTPGSAQTAVVRQEEHLSSKQVGDNHNSRNSRPGDNHNSRNSKLGDNHNSPDGDSNKPGGNLFSQAHRAGFCWCCYSFY